MAEHLESELPASEIILDPITDPDKPLNPKIIAPEAVGIADINRPLADQVCSRGGNCGLRKFIGLYLVGDAQTESLDTGLVARFCDIGVVENRGIGKF